MNQQQTSTSITRLAAVGILLIILYLVWYLIVMPFFGLWKDKVGEIDFLQQQQSRLQYLIEDGDTIRNRFRQMEQDKTLNNLFLAEKSGALSDAKFQRIVRQLVTQSGARVIQIVLDNARPKQAESAPDDATDQPSITVRVVMQGDIKAIYGTLHKLENSRPLIILSNLDISHSRGRYQIARSNSPTMYTASYDATAFIL